MSLYHILIHSEEGWQVSNLLGQLSCVQIIDLNSAKLPYEKRYFKELERIEEADRRIW
jgi:hypothetical protein